jgi:Polyketide cyclase / dehydrase and lipid transport
MGTQVIDKTATTSGSPEAVYSFLADGATWPRWSPLGAFELLEPGDGSPEGLGAVRLFTTGRHRSRERVVERVPGRRFAYVLEAGLALRNYRAVITLVPSEDGGTTITWRSTFRAKMPGTGWIYRRQLGAFIGETVDGLAVAAAGEPSEGAARAG